MFGQREKLGDLASIKDQGANQKVEFEIKTPKKITNNPIEQSENVHELELQSIATKREMREIKKPMRYADYIDIIDTNSIAYALVVAENIDYDEPRSYKEAMQSKKAPEWMIAMNEEMRFLKKKITWDLVTLPKGVKLIGWK
jgi:hypothetical protein